MMVMLEKRWLSAPVGSRYDVGLTLARSHDDKDEYCCLTGGGGG